MDIQDAYDYTDKLTEKLTKSLNIIALSKEFNDIKDNAEKVKFLEKLLIENNLIPKIKDFHKPKNAKLSCDYRNEGNILYKGRKYMEALECYNKSICFGEKTDVGISYANRSAIYSHMKLYKRALANIEMAIEHDYPEKMLDKLMIRKASCQNSIDQDSEATKSEMLAEEHLKMSHKVNPKIPFIADCLQLKSSDQFGRYVVTDTELLPGEIIAIEEPFSKSLLPTSAYKYCVNCLQHNFLDLYPCSHCTVVMFCSEQCRAAGTSKFHKFECNIIGVLNGIYTKIMRLANFTFYEALYSYDSDIDQLMSAMDEMENDSVTVYDLESDGGKKQVFTAINALVSNEKYRSVSDMFQRSGIVAILTHLMLNFTPLKAVLDTEDKKDFYRQFVIKQTQIAALNYHGIFDGILTKTEIHDNVQYATGSYPFCSLINHSCAPNLVRVSFESRNYIMVNRPIKAGEQLFDNYGQHHCLETLKQRRMALKSQYMFYCMCDACQHDYPLFDNLKKAVRTVVVESGDINRLQSLNLETAKKKFGYFREKLSELDEYGLYPCREISSLQECLLRCLFIFKMTRFNMETLKMH